jgi:hypothetical protein
MAAEFILPTARQFSSPQRIGTYDHNVVTDLRLGVFADPDSPNDQRR